MTQTECTSYRYIAGGDDNRVEPSKWAGRLTDSSACTLLVRTNVAKGEVGECDSWERPSSEGET